MRLPRAVFPVLVLLALLAASGCGRKAKPEPLRSDARYFLILNQ